MQATSFETDLPTSLVKGVLDDNLCGKIQFFSSNKHMCGIAKVKIDGLHAQW